MIIGKNRDEYLFILIFFIIFCVSFCGYMVSIENYWTISYETTIIVCLIYLYIRRENYFTVSWLVIVMNLIGITLPIFPSLFFFDEVNDSIKKAIYIHSWGIILFIICILFQTPSFKHHKVDTEKLKSNEWDVFFSVNKVVYFSTIPLVILLLIVSGAWKVYSGLEESGFSRVADLKGLGPMIIFSYINVLSGSFWGMSLFLKKNTFSAIFLLIFTIFINNIGYGRGNIITMLCVLFFFFGIRQRFSFKVPLVMLMTGFIIVFSQMLRSSGEQSYDTKLLEMLLKFSGDFPEVVNTSALIEYLKHSNYFGGNIIWGNLWYYIPRTLYTGKPDSYGGLELTANIFPDMFSGKEGSTTTFGIYGTLFSVYGVPSVIVGIIFLAALLGQFEKKVITWIAQPKPNILLIYYVIFMGFTQILHREGFLAIFNSFNQCLLYYIYYSLIKYVISFQPRD